MAAEPSITRSAEELHDVVSDIPAQTDKPVQVSKASFAFDTPTATSVAPRFHTDQDERRIAIIDKVADSADVERIAADHDVPPLG